MKRTKKPAANPVPRDITFVRRVQRCDRCRTQVSEPCALVRVDLETGVCPLVALCFTCLDAASRECDPARYALRVGGAILKTAIEMGLEQWAKPKPPQCGAPTGMITHPKCNLPLHHDGHHCYMMTRPAFAEAAK